MVVFPSWAARPHGEAGPLPADIDVLVVGDGIDRPEVYAAADRAEARLVMAVNPVLRPAGLWTDAAGDALLTEIQSRGCAATVRSRAPPRRRALLLMVNGIATGLRDNG